MKYQPKVTKPKKVEHHKSLATPKPRKPRFLLMWSPTGRLFDQEGKLDASSNSKSQYDCSNGDNACTSNAMEPKIKRFPNSTSLLDRKKQTSISSTKTSSKLKAEITSSSYGLVWTNENCQYKWQAAIATACFTQNRFIIHHRFNKTPYELINGKKPNISFLHVFGALCYPKNDREDIGKLGAKGDIGFFIGKPDISFLHVFGALCYPKNDREDIGKLGAKGDIGFFIGYSADSCAYRIYNRRTKKIIETMNVSFDELSAMAFEQCSSKPRLQSMTFGQISSGLDLTYAPSTITKQQPTESELDL
nr:hypothetical protein [Tanacetum cinerariifolium]